MSQLTLSLEANRMTTASPPALLKLSDLSARIDIPGFYSKYVIVSGKPTNSRKEGREYACSCPICFGVDRASFWDSGRFCCVRGCQAHCSSPYFFLRDIQGYTHAQALEELGIDQEEIGSSYEAAPRLPLYLTNDEPPNKKWQDRAGGFIRACEYILWSSKGESARKYLQSRGFTDETIKQAHLGLCDRWHIKPLEEWGLSPEQVGKTEESQISIPRGITIPWFVDGSSIHKIQLRRPEGGYFEILGSQDECLYSLAPITEKPVVLVESELDALSVHQMASDLVTAVATGGVSKGQTSASRAILKRASRILQSFDDDEPGNRAAEQWLGYHLPIIRHAPWAHDCNDMLREDTEHIRIWVEQGLWIPEETEATEPPALDRTGKVVPPELYERVLAFQDACLARKKICCDTLDWMIDPADGYLICPCVEDRREENRLLDLKLVQQKQLASFDW